MIDVHAVDAKTRLEYVSGPYYTESCLATHHPCPLSIHQILFSRTSDALGLVQAEQTVIILSHDVFGRQKIIEQPLFPESAYIGTED